MKASLGSAAWIVTGLCALAGCRGTTGGPPAASIVYADPGTVITRQLPDGTISETHGLDPELKGRKEVGVQITFFQERELVSTLLTYWRAGQNDAAQTIEQTHHQLFTPPASGGVQTTVRTEIPGAADLDLCEGLYYMWTVTHRPVGGNPALYVGQPHLILPTKRQLPNGQIEQAICSEPPGPSE